MVKKSARGHVRGPFVPVLASAPHSSAIPRARAIKYRQENQEAVGGFFSQIGELYVVHHLWGRLWTLQELSASYLSLPSLCIDNVISALVELNVLVEGDSTSDVN